MKVMSIGLCICLYSLLFPATGRGQQKLTKISFKVMAEAACNKLEKLYVHIAAKEGRSALIAAGIKVHAGRVYFQDDTVDYIRACVTEPEVYRLAADPNVEALQVIDLSQTRQTGSAAMPEMGNKTFPEQPKRSNGIDTALQKPVAYPFSLAYHPWQDVDAYDLFKRNKRFDGRGVTAGFIEWLPNLIMPEMKEGYDLRGNIVPKVKDIVLTADGDSILGLYQGKQYYSFADKVTSLNKRVTYRDTVYSVPYEGTFMICYSPDKSQTRKGALRLTGPFAILWDKEKGMLWIDHDHDHDFASDKALQLYSIHSDVDAAGFVMLDVRPDKNQVYLVSTDHGQHTPMAMASIGANKATGGLFNGMAPGVSEIAYLDVSGATHLENIIRAFRDPRADIVGSDNAVNYSITQASAMEMSGTPTVYEIIVNRCIRKFDKLFIKSASNDDGLNNLDIMTSGAALSVGAYHSSENLRMNNGVIQPHKDDLHWYSAWGPNDMGELKPDILAPSQWMTYYYPRDELRPGQYIFPPGYALGGGTSQACPTAEGAIALIMSACRQTGIAYDHKKLKWAITSTARFSSDLMAVQQGNGILQVNKTYQLLQQLNAGDAPGGCTLDMEVKAKVVTETSYLLPVPGEGKGIFEKIGWKAGDKGTRVIRLTRHGGSRKSVRCAVQWLGNDSSIFSCDTVVVLPYNKEIKLPVRIGPLKQGVNSALIRLHSDAYLGDIAKIMVCIVATEPLTDSFALGRQFKVPRPNGKIAGYYQIGDSVSAVGLSYHAESPQWLSMLTVRPPFFLYDRNQRSMNGFDKRVETSFDNPDNGVYELLLHDRRDVSSFDIRHAGAPLPPSNVYLELKMYGIRESGYMGTIADSGLQTFGFTNRFAPFTGAMTTNALGYMHQQTDSLPQAGYRLYEVQVDPGSAQLSVYYKTLTSDADVDLYIFEPSQQNGKTVWKTKDWDYGNRSFSLIEIPDPIPGKWKIAVVNVHCSGPLAGYHYADVVQHPRYGSFTAMDDVRQHPMKDHWSADGKIWLNPAVRFADRKPAVLVKVVSGVERPVTVGWQLYEIGGKGL